MDLPVRITRLNADIPLPRYETEGAVAFDIAAAKQVVVAPKTSTLMPTGLIIAVPTGYALILAERSSTFRKKGLKLGNGVGVIDQDFHGPEDELMVSLWNPSDQEIIVEQGERIAQGFFVPILRAVWEENEASGPSRGGFGTSGGYKN